MNPKKPKSILSNFHTEVELDETTVNDILDFYWSNVRKSIISVTYPRINIENLGVFELKWKKLNDTLDYYKKKLDTLNALNFSRYPRYQYALDRAEILEKAKNEMIAERARRKTVIVKRYGDTNRSVEEERKDS